jgi:hypothetical protein
MLLVPTIKGEDNLLDRTLNLHHYCQVRLQPQFTPAELDAIAEKIKNAQP